jgi:hypothetical protein
MVTEIRTTVKEISVNFTRKDMKDSENYPLSNSEL